MLVIVGSPRVESEVKTFQIRLHTWVSHDHVYQNPRRRFQGLEVKEPNRLSSPSGTSPSRRTNQSSPSIRLFLRHSCIDPVGPMLFLCIVWASTFSPSVRSWVTPLKTPCSVTMTDTSSPRTRLLASISSFSSSILQTQVRKSLCQSACLLERPPTVLWHLLHRTDPPLFQPLGPHWLAAPTAHTVSSSRRHRLRFPMGWLTGGIIVPLATSCGWISLSRTFSRL